MLLNLLNDWLKFDIGEGAFYAVFGFLFVFTGIVVLILIFTGLGLLMKKLNSRSAKPKKDEKGKAEAAPVPIESGEGITPEIVAVISAAIAAYYEGVKPENDFIVRRIKRL